VTNRFLVMIVTAWRYSAGRPDTAGSSPTVARSADTHRSLHSGPALAASMRVTTAPFAFAMGSRDRAGSSRTAPWSHQR
jgi:hypothetical protein